MRVNLDYSEYRKKKKSQSKTREKAEKKNNFFMLAFQSLKLKGVVVIMLFFSPSRGTMPNSKETPLHYSSQGIPTK